VPQPEEKLKWRQSSLCGSGACLEVAEDLELIHIRDAKDPAGPHLTISPPVWRSFIHGIKTGRYDAPSAARH
jgi:Domain of unknown function (DUF397)